MPGSAFFLGAVKMRTIVITGGTSGIGLATAQLFLDRGDAVVAVARSKEKYDAALTKLTEGQNRYYFVQADISKCGQCKNAVDKIAARFSTVDVLVNSAGIYQEKPISDVEEKDFDEIMGVNVKGTYFMCKYMLRLLQQSTSSPAIVNVSSDAGVNGNYFCSVYCASKGAVTIFTKALALELASYSIRVNCICPGDIDTPLTQSQFDGNIEAAQETASIYPLGRIGTAREAASVIYFLASAEASFVTGAAWAVDGGLTSC
ncbi:NAD(P)-dependent dehydrogenase (short-subunit alcohol dehydrogenase family) [Pectinatus cerevisiiphilus]|uniref:NAD(P)-dependent dehydrogenase (Short-subunit alcohol dehydrogenase family) n=2 Tax=Pectinatus cerevisiiphilus TaxID=86956 RepID=A0A4R3K8D2_9FIRM|nr:NAD(P)-dependent dehydrogenase (short-subunit alcohol dehydrogenase family) [Pectinatus cerevisiiphilus]